MSPKPITIPQPPVIFSGVRIPREIACMIVEYCDFKSKICLQRTSRSLYHAINANLADNLITGRTLDNLQTLRRSALSEAFYTLALCNSLLAYTPETTHDIVKSFPVILIEAINRFFFPQFTMGPHNEKKHTLIHDCRYYSNPKVINHCQATTRRFLDVAEYVLTSTNFSYDIHSKIIRFFKFIKLMHDRNTEAGENSPFADSALRSVLLLVRVTQLEHLHNKTITCAHELINLYNDSQISHDDSVLPVHPFVQQAYSSLEPTPPAKHSRKCVFF